MKNNYIIYKVLNFWTGEVYIGATTNSMEQRRLDHTERAKRGETGKFYVALASWTNAFTWTQIDTVNSIDELAQKEKEYIIQYDSKNKGYNSDAGGGMQKTVFQYSTEDGSLMNTYNSLQSAADSVGVYKSSISSACLGVNKTCQGFYWSYVHPIPLILKDARKKKVLQLDLNGLFMAEYESISQASRETGVSKTCISRCARGEREQSSGYMWKYH